MRLLGEKQSTMCHELISGVVWQAASFPTMETKPQAKNRMKGGRVQAEDLYVIIIFFKNTVKHSQENPLN